MKIVAITGMPGAGKSTAAQALAAKGWKRVVMGDVIREETRRRGLPEDEKHTGEVMKDLRRQLGEAAVAELCLKSIREAGYEKVVVDGVRSVAEVEAFRKAADVLLIAVQASRPRRYSFLKGRGRGDDPDSMEMFQRRDDRELEVGIGRAIALADETVSNEHASPEALSAQTLKLVERWLDGSA
ncbi:MAG: AAA family ATPase [Nitrososphaerota archaeon]|nr:AAA family ATPase [Nitrososphaerota archaeon]